MRSRPSAAADSTTKHTKLTKTPLGHDQKLFVLFVCFVVN